MQEAFKAISDPTRRLLLKYLRRGERTAGELADYVGIGRTALSHHLTVLKLADLVRVERRGQYQVYSLNATVFEDLLTEILSWFGGPEEEQSSEATSEESVKYTASEDSSITEEEYERSRRI